MAILCTSTATNPTYGKAAKYHRFKGTIASDLGWQKGLVKLSRGAIFVGVKAKAMP
jgi:hypothetical protein